MEVLTAAQMRAAEQAAIDKGDVTGLELMERAGVGVVEAIFEWRSELAEGDGRAVVLCGPGNNGGDGFVIARLLKERGWTVEVFLYGDESKLPPDAAENCRRWRELGGLYKLDDFPDSDSPEPDLLIDALFGTGLTRPLDPEVSGYAHVIHDGREKCLIVAVDIPSGVCADSGKELVQGPHSYFADLIVTFHRPKQGHFLSSAIHGFRNTAPELKVFDIGLSESRGRRDGVVTLAEATSFRHDPTGHKYSHGHALVVSGGMAKTGAARLAARGALRAGAGLVTVASPPDALMENATHLTAIMLHKMKGADGLGEILSDARINSVVIGPGCGIGEETRALVEVALRATEVRGVRTVILDADALTSFEDSPETLFDLIKSSPCEAILTPHSGEFARIFPDIATRLQDIPTKGPAFSKVDAVREAAPRSGATVLFKGADTVIAEPNGRCSIAAAVYDRAAPWLATAGSGDVLAGIIAGLAARGTSNPAVSGAWLHQECGRHLGPGLIAEDIPEVIPSVLKQIFGWKRPTNAR